MGIVQKAGDLAFKTFTAGLGLTTVFLAGSFSLNLYNGISWHNAQSKIEQQSSGEQEQ